MWKTCVIHIVLNLLHLLFHGFPHSFPPKNVENYKKSQLFPHCVWKELCGFILLLLGEKLIPDFCFNYALPIVSVQSSHLNGFRYMHGVDLFGKAQVCYGSCHLEYSVVASGGKTETVESVV